MIGYLLFNPLIPNTTEQKGFFKNSSPNKRYYALFIALLLARTYISAHEIFSKYMIISFIKILCLQVYFKTILDCLQCYHFAKHIVQIRQINWKK
jgi:hypothetical protein